jgi:ribosome biogenesis protein Nip4
MDKFVSLFTNKKLSAIKIGKRFYQTNITVHPPIEPFSVGIYLGENKREFKPTPALLDMIAPHTEKKATINKNAEWLFLCGRDVFKENVIEGKEGLVLVQNERKEILGYGKYRKGILKNYLDKGDYLRRER